MSRSLDHRVVVGQYRLDAVDSRVGHIDAALSDLGDASLDDLHLDGSVAVGSAVFIRGFAAGRGAVDTRSTRRLDLSELATAASALGGQFHGPSDPGRAVETPLPGLV